MKEGYKQSNGPAAPVVKEAVATAEQPAQPAVKPGFVLTNIQGEIDDQRPQAQRCVAPVLP